MPEQETARQQRLSELMTQPGMKKQTRKRKLYLVTAGILAVAFGNWYAGCLPRPLFKPGYSTVLKAEDGSLLAARLAPDEHWRFPQSDSLPERFKTALITFEDRHFYDHWGVSVSSIMRALRQNIKRGEVVRGGSTLTMQVVRMARGNPRRSYWEKLTEMIRATRLELALSKDQIMEAWAAHAPFGGNVVGLEAASWRYFSLPPHALSWAQTATLVVLPNAPSLIYPGKNQERLRAKRDRLLDNLSVLGHISPEDCELAKMEDLPGRPYPMPTESAPLLNSMMQRHGNGHFFETTINPEMQRRLTEVMNRHHALLSASFIQNMACIIIDHRQNRVVAYGGNIHDVQNRHANQVDCARAPRSSGSLLKPFLYALALDEGLILPTQLLADVPFSIGGFSPKNHNEKYDGAVPANEALTRSLNVTAVKLLREYNEVRFIPALQKLGLRDINKPSGHYGLTVVVGGAESSLFDLTTAYAAMARSLWIYQENQLYSDTLGRARLLTNFQEKEKIKLPFGPGATYAVLEMMKGLVRPDESIGWQHFETTSDIAWKTGTSQGNRDGWAIGCDGRYTMGVWLGNANGVGRDNLTGVGAAAPVLFDLFNLVPASPWLLPPLDHMEKIEVCKQSGHLPTDQCLERDSVWVPNGRDVTSVCPYHRVVFLNDKGQRVNQQCAPDGHMTAHPWFVLTPDRQWYYRNRHPEYKPLPPWSASCADDGEEMIQLISPVNLGGLFIPKELDGSPGRLVFTASHQLGRQEPLHWHLDEQFLGTTTHLHELQLTAKPGDHTLAIMDQYGNYALYRLKIMGNP